MKKGEIFKSRQYEHPFIFIKNYNNDPDLFVGVMLTTTALYKGDVNINLRNEHIRVINAKEFRRSHSYVVNDWLLKKINAIDAPKIAELTEEGILYLDQSIPEDNEPILWDARQRIMFGD
jgi:hypothetical protein